jgi:hypothetical protein
MASEIQDILSTTRSIREATLDDNRTRCEKYILELKDQLEDYELPVDTHTELQEEIDAILSNLEIRRDQTMDGISNKQEILNQIHRIEALYARHLSSENIPDDGEIEYMERTEFEDFVQSEIEFYRKVQEDLDEMYDPELEEIANGKSLFDND